MADYNGLTRNAWPGTWSPSSNHPIVLDTEMRGGLRYVSGDSGDRVSDITGQRLQDGMLIYVKKAHEGFEAEQYYSFKLQSGQYRDSSTGELPNASNNWEEFRPKVDSATTTNLIDSAYIQARQNDSAETATNAYRLNGQSGNYYREWANTLNPPAILDNVDVSNIITTDVDKAFVDALNVDADTLDGLHKQDYINLIDSAVNALVDGAPGALDTLNELAAALNDDSDAYNTLLAQIAALPDSSQVQLITETQVDSAYVQARQDFAYSSLTGAPTNVSTFTNDANYLDSTTAQTLIDATYIQQNQSNIDSSLVSGLVDSAYVQARQDFAYGSLTGVPTNVSTFTNDANYLDSTTVQGVVDQSYVTGLIDATYLDSAEVIALIDSDHVRNRATFGLAGNTGSHTFRPDTETLTFLGTTGQINAGIAANNVTLELDQNINSITSIAFEGGSNNNNETKIQAIDPTKDNTINLPDSSGTVALVETIDSAFVQARTPQIDLSAVDQHIIPATGTLYDLGDSNHFWRDLYLSGSTLVLGDLKLQQHSGNFRFTNRHNGNEVKVVADNVSPHLIDSSVITSLSSALDISTFTNDANYLDSNTVKEVIDSTYIAAAIETDSNITVTIINNVTDTVDSAYVLGRVAAAPFLDSADAIQLIDSTYVQARQDFAYGSLTGVPTTVSSFTNDANYLDSTTVLPLLPKFGADFVDSATVLDIINSAGLDSDLVIALVDSAYIQLRDRFQDSSLVTSTVDATYVQSRQITYNTSDFLDSGTVSLVVDSAYVLARSPAGVDSASVTAIIDSAYIAARVSGADSAEIATNAYRFNNEAPSYYLDYNNLSNKPSIPTIDKTYVDNLNVDADTLDNQDGSYYLNYNNLNNKPTVLTSTDVKNIFNSSGDDEISTGAVVDAKYIEFKHDGGTQHEFTVEVVSKTSAHRYQGSGSSNGYQIDGVESPFLQFVPGNTYRFLQNNGTNSSHQIRFYYDAAKTTAYTTGVTLNGNAGQAGAYTEIVVSDATPAVLYYQCVNHGYMGNAVFTQTRNLTGFTTDDLTEGSSNKYYTDALGDSAVNAGLASIDSDYIQQRTRIGLGDIDFGANKILYANVYSTTGDLPSASTYHGMFAHVHGTGKAYYAHGGNWIELANASSTFSGNYNDLSNKPAFLDSSLTTQLIDSAYVQSRQTTGGGGTVDSADIIAIVDSAYVTARYTGAGITLSTARQGISVTTGAASGGGQLQYDNSTGVFTFNPSTNTGGGGGGGGTADGITLTKYVFTADSAQTAFADSDDNGLLLTYDDSDTQLNVYLNGILLVDSDDFTLTNSTTVTLTTGANLNDVVQIIKYTPPSGGGSGSGVDSAATLNLIDSDYVLARVGPIGQGTLAVNKYFFDATAGQGNFAGADKFGNTLSITPANIEVYLNGILLVETTDYTATTDAVSLTAVADSGYSLTVIETIGQVNTHQAMVETVFEFDADSGQTVFSGIDRGGLKTLQMSDGIVSVFVNGVLISDVNDYTTTGTALTLLDPADSGDFISVKVTRGTVASSLNTKQYVFTGQTGTTLTGGGLGFTGNVQIFKNGDPLKESEFAISGGDTITLQSAAIGSDQFIVQTFNAQEFTGKSYDFVADSGQTVFTGNDRHGNRLYYRSSGALVYLNGIALVDQSDYVATNEQTLTMNEPVAANDELKIYTFIPADLSSIASPLSQVRYEYTATAAQSIFTGADSNGQVLSFDSDLVSVYMNGLLLRSEDFTATGGNTITLGVGADAGDNVTVEKLTGNNIGLGRQQVQAMINASGGNTWGEATASKNISAGSKNIVDTNSTTVTLTLPGSPALGDEVRVIDGTGNASVYNIIIDRNANNIMGSSSNLVIDVDRAAIGLVYYNASQGWILIEN